MKTKFRILALVLIALLTLSGCKWNSDSSEPPVDEEPVVDPIALEIENFFKQYVNTDERPIAIMIDNDDKNARPQIGLNDAYLVYEIIVEGGATRFMAFYRNADTAKIGPIRSSRHYFLDYLREHDGIYVHCGWSDRAGAEITSLGIDKINGILGVYADTFWREDKFVGDWHSTYTSMEKIKTKSEKKGFETVTDKSSSIKYSDTYFDLPDAKSAYEIHLPYSGIYNTGYTYNPDTMLYEKKVLRAPYVMQDGSAVTAKNIIIQFIGDRSLGDGTPRREVITTGSGRGYYITNGACEEITWSKSARDANTVYKRADGTELAVNPGKTFVNIISPDSGAVITPAPPEPAEDAVSEASE